MAEDLSPKTHIHAWARQEVWDNADQYIRWLPDALAAAVTGIS